MYDMHEVARVADTLSNTDVNKRSLYELVIKIASNDGAVTVEELARFYRAYSPAHPAKPKIPEQWVWKAVAKNDVRNYLNYAYSDGRRLIGTDGHRMHVWHTTLYSPGFYDKNMVRIHEPEFARYPEIDRVIPNAKNTKHLKTPDDFKVFHNDESTKKPEPLVMCEDVCFSDIYIKDAISGMKQPLVHLRDKTDACMIIDEDLLAVVMPRRY